MILALAQVDRAELFGHAPTRDHRAGHFRCALDVIVSTGTDIADQGFLRRPPGEQDDQLRSKIVFRQGVMFFRTEHMRATKCPAPRDDRDLVERVRSRCVIGDRRVAGLVHGEPVALLGLDGQCPDGSHHHLVARVLQIRASDLVVAAPGRVDRGLVQQVLQIGTGKAWRTRRDRVEIAGLRQRQPAGVDTQNRASRSLIRQVQHHMPIEPPGS